MSVPVPVPGSGEHLGPEKQLGGQVRLRGGFGAVHRAGENVLLRALFL